MPETVRLDEAHRKHLRRRAEHGTVMILATWEIIALLDATEEKNMEINIHDITGIRVDRQQYETFETVTVTITDKDGATHILRSFNNDPETSIKVEK